MPNFGWIRNPLSIIALFISLIYGMSAVLFGYSVSSLSTGNQTVLVCFIVLFPFAVLGVFSWLVAKHHSKLYGPGDYRSDDSFMSTFRSATAIEISAKQEAEIEAQITPPRSGITIDVPTAIIDIKKEASTTDLLETLAIKRYAQNEKYSVLRSQLKIGNTLILDAVLDSPSKFTVIEVKVLQRVWYLFTALQQGSRVLRRAKDLFVPSGRRVETVLIVVFVDEPYHDELKKQYERLSLEERPDRIEQYTQADLLALALPSQAVAGSDM